MGGEMRLNEFGEMVKRSWDDLVSHYHRVTLDAFVVMPNHVHGIIVLDQEDVGAGFNPAPTDHGFTKRHGLGEIVRGFKTFSARRINQTRATPGTAVWQRNYYEHVIRNEPALNRIRQYIVDNPAKWDTDPENPHVLSAAHNFRPQGRV